MDIGILFDWFTQESLNAALAATQWEQREYWLRLALLWGAAAHECRKKTSPTPSATDPAQAPPQADEPRTSVLPKGYRSRSHERSGSPSPIRVQT
jgi:hypothetical protein